MEIVNTADRIGCWTITIVVVNELHIITVQDDDIIASFLHCW